jgi:hypothetical protein
MKSSSSVYWVTSLYNFQGSHYKVIPFCELTMIKKFIEKFPQNILLFATCLQIAICHSSTFFMLHWPPYFCGTNKIWNVGSAPFVFHKSVEKLLLISTNNENFRQCNSCLLMSIVTTICAGCWRHKDHQVGCTVFGSIIFWRDAMIWLQ